MGRRLEDEEEAMSNLKPSCALCRGGRLIPGSTTMTLERDGITLVVKGVPALVCDVCGEAYLEADVTKQLFSDADLAAKRGAEVEVRRFVAA
jgi:YgiT-type zinc finger domain-containing protein